MELRNRHILLGAALVLVLVGAGCANSSNPPVDNSVDPAVPTVNYGDQAAGRSFTMEEVSQHNTPADCWMVVVGKVVDGSKAMGFHGKNKDQFLALCGQDATQAFMTRGQEPPNPHPESADDVLDKIYLGELAQ